MVCGVYTITAPSGGQYVGSSFQIEKRLAEHKFRLSRKAHPNRLLQRSWNKYDHATFVFRTILVCPPGDLLLYEQLAIDALKPRYNIRKHAQNNAGLIHSVAARAKMSAARLGFPLQPDHRAAVAASNRQRNQSYEHRAKITAALNGRKRPRLSAALKGHSTSPETRAKIAASLRGKSPSAETRAKLGAASVRTWTGRKHSAETRAKLSEVAKKRKHSPERIAKQAASLKANWATKDAATRAQLLTPMKNARWAQE